MKLCFHMQKKTCPQNGHSSRTTRPATKQKSQKLFLKKFCDCDGLASSVPQYQAPKNLWGIIKAQIKKDKPPKIR